MSEHITIKVSHTWMKIITRHHSLTVRQKPAPQVLYVQVWWLLLFLQKVWMPQNVTAFSEFFLIVVNWVFDDAIMNNYSQIIMYLQIIQIMNLTVSSSGWQKTFLTFLISLSHTQRGVGLRWELCTRVWVAKLLSACGSLESAGEPAQWTGGR